MARKTEKVLGYDVDLMTFDEAVSFVIDKIGKEEGLQIVTINPEMIELANKNKVFSNIIKNADLIVPDGSGIKLALKLKGIKQEQIPGIDLAKELLDSCSFMGYPVALIGAREHVIETTVKRLRAEFKNLDICYYRNGYFTIQKENEIIEKLKETEPKLVLVALGAPKQEIFIQKCKKELPAAAFIGVGGTFDVWSGEVERAPEFFRVMGWEWVYRTYKQPSRLKRIYKTLPLFLFKAIIDSVKNKNHSALKEN